MASRDELIEIMARYQAGDASAFDALFEAVSPRVLPYLMRSTGERAQAEDVLQEVFLNVHRARATYRPGAPVLPWIFAIARHAAASRARAAWRKREEAREDLSDLPAAAPEEDPEDPRMEAIEAAISELPEAQREVVMMLKVSGLSLAEVARATGSTVGAVKLRAHRAYEALRKKLGAKGIGPKKQEDAA